MAIRTETNNSNINYNVINGNQNVSKINSEIKSTSSSANYTPKPNNVEEYYIVPIRDSTGNTIPNNIMKLYDRDKIFLSSKVLDIISIKKEKYQKIISKAKTGISGLLTNKVDDLISHIISKKEEDFKSVLSRYYMDIEEDEILYVDPYENKVYLRCGLVFTIENDEIISVKNVETNMEYYLEEGKTYFKSIIDRENNIKYKEIDGNIEPVTLFDNVNIDSGQYGGDQGAFDKNAEELLKDPLIISRLKEYYPDASMEDYHLYLCKLNTCGCGYTALVNTVFNEYQGREKEFEQKFGYPMYTVNSDGDVDYNYEYMILDYFNYIWGNSEYSIQELYGDVTYDATDGAISGEFNTGKAEGMIPDRARKFGTFLNEKYGQNINMDAKNEFDTYGDFGILTGNNVIDVYNSLKTDNNQIIIGGSGYNLYNMDGTLYTSNGGGHAMYITGVTSDNNFIVSSWGEQFILDVSNIDNKDNGWMRFNVIDYNN